MDASIITLLQPDEWHCLVTGLCLSAGGAVCGADMPHSSAARMHAMRAGRRLATAVRHRQLRHGARPTHVLQRAQARSLGYQRSLFSRMEHNGVRCCVGTACSVAPTWHSPQLLNVQYRMHPMIRQFPSDYFYAGRRARALIHCFLFFLAFVSQSMVVHPQVDLATRPHCARVPCLLGTPTHALRRCWCDSSVRATVDAPLRC